MSGSPPSDEVVSVLIPVYNGRAYLEQALATVLHQTHTALEIIVVDDGSTDDSPRILTKMAAIDPRLHIVRKANGGISSALNAGLAVATGTFTARMDADDLMKPHRIATQLAFLQANPTLGFCASFMEIIDGFDRVLRAYTPEPVTRATLAAQIARKTPITYTHPTVMFRTALARDLGGYDPNFEPCEDTDLFGRMITSGMPGLVIPETLMAYRMHAASISGSKTRAQVEMLEHVRRNFYLRLAGQPEIGVHDRDQYLRTLPLAARALYRADIKSQTLRQLAAYDRAEGRLLRGFLRLGAAASLRPHKLFARLARSIGLHTTKAS